jgi:hypothetical protein
MRNISSLYELSPFVGESSLVVFDLDDTLIRTKNPAFQRPLLDRYKKDLQKCFQNLKENERYELMMSIVLGSEMELIEESTPKFLQELHSNRIDTIGLTASFSGNLGKFSLIEELRHETLISLGIEFSKKNLSQEKVPLELNQTRVPIFHQGTLYANFIDKGKVLLACLDKFNLQPSHILFIDDRIEHLYEMGESLTARGISHNLFHKVASQPSKEITKEAFLHSLSTSKNAYIREKEYNRLNSN